MSNVDSRLKKYFNEYDSSAPISSGFDGKQIESILNGSSGKEMPSKITAFCKVVSSVESAINARLGENRSNISAINISNNLTISSNPNDPEYSTKITMSKAEGEGVSSKVANISLNVNVQKMLKLPAEQIYAKIYALVESSVFDKVLEKNIAEPEVQNVQSVELVRNAEEAEKLTGENSKENRTLLGRIVKYIVDGLRQLFGSDYSEEKLEEISKNIARDYSTAYGGTSEAYSEMFDVSALKGDPSVQELKAARRSKILQNAEKAAEEGEPQTELSYREQAMALLSEDTKGAFEQMKLYGASEMQGFCTSFIADYLEANGHSAGDVEVVFTDDPNAPQGLFTSGTPARITINTAKVKDVTDMVMTITHESKHAIDALSNGERTERYRLDNVAKSISVSRLGLTPGTPEFKFIKKLNAIAYHIDPNERRGREAELAGLEFMQQMAGGDANISKEIENNIIGFNKYQKRTADMIKGLSLKPGDGVDKNSRIWKYSLECLEEEFAALGGLNLPESFRDEVYRQLEYIKARMREPDFNAQREEASIQSTRQIAQNLKGQEHLTEQELEDLQMQ